MKKLALGVLVAAGMAFAVPAHAQGFWFGIGPVGVGVGTAPYAYDYPGYWGAPVYQSSYGYAAPNYLYEPGYAYAPGYAYEPYTTYSYAPEYSYQPYTYSTSTYSYAPAYRSYAYEPRTVSVYTTRHRRNHARVHVVSSQALRAQASVPVHHRRHHRHVTVRY